MKKIMNEKLTITTSNPVRARFYEYPRFTYPWHFHSEYEIIYVEKGEGDCLVGDSIISYSKGDLILFGSYSNIVYFVFSCLTTTKGNSYFLQRKYK